MGFGAGFPGKIEDVSPLRCNSKHSETVWTTPYMLNFYIYMIYLYISISYFDVNLEVRVLRPVMSAVPLCPHADITERLVRPVMSVVPLCPWWIFIVPLYPRADITERLVCPVMSTVPLCPQCCLSFRCVRRNLFILYVFILSSCKSAINHLYICFYWTMHWNKLKRCVFKI